LIQKDNLFTLSADIAVLTTELDDTKAELATAKDTIASMASQLTAVLARLDTIESEYATVQISRSS